MSNDMILFVAIAVFALLLIGLGFTVWEFRNTVDVPSQNEGADSGKSTGEPGR